MRSKIVGSPVPVLVLFGLLTPTGSTGLTGLTGRGSGVVGPTLVGGCGSRKVQWIPVQGGGGVCCLEGEVPPSTQSERRLSHFTVQASVLPPGPHLLRQPRHMASQAISIKVLLAARLSLGSRTLKAQIAVNASVANANVLILMRNFIIVLPRDVCIYSAMCWLSHTELSPRSDPYVLRGRAAVCSLAEEAVGTRGRSRLLRHGLLLWCRERLSRRARRKCRMSSPDLGPR